MAPNVCALVGSRITAKLLALTGGLTALSKTPSCNLQVCMCVYVRVCVYAVVCACMCVCHSEYGCIYIICVLCLCGCECGWDAYVLYLRVCSVFARWHVSLTWVWVYVRHCVSVCACMRACV